MTETAKKVNIDDGVLIRKCSLGDKDAMETLILKYQNRIYNVILRICANPDDAAELTQETFIRVIEKIDDFQGRSSFYTWLFRIAVNLTLTHCKKSHRLGFTSLDTAISNKDQDARVMLKQFLIDESSPDPVELAQSKELCLIINAALMKLDEPHRAVIVLRDIESMDYTAIAETLELQLGTVKSRISRARVNLRQILEAMLP